MNRFSRLLFGFFIAGIIPVAAAGQLYEGFPFINDKSLPEAIFQSQRTFTGESLFGYMNGGAELYLEYGFDRMQVTELTYRDKQFKIEIYHMDDIESAFGIYSVSVFRCDRKDNYGDFSCQSSYQLQICREEYYINIINNAGSKEEIEYSHKLAEVILEQIEGESYTLESWLNNVKLEKEPSTTRLFKGELGLYNGAFDWYEQLRGIEGYTAVLFDMSDEVMLSLRFSDQEKKREFINRYEQVSQLQVCTDENRQINEILSNEGNSLVILRKF